MIRIYLRPSIRFLAAVAWTCTDLAVVLLLGARAEVYLFPAAKLVPNLIAGTLSGFVTALLLRTLPQTGLPTGTGAEAGEGRPPPVAASRQGADAPRPPMS